MCVCVQVVMLESRLLAAESRVSHLELEKSSAVFSLERRMSTENTKLQVCRRLCGVSCGMLS